VAVGRLDANRDVIFAAWSGEELGLLGASHFVDARMAASGADDLADSVSAYLNMDMIGRLEDKVIAGGTGSSPIWAREIERRTAVVGLGTGALACYALPGESWRFFEIDPTVARIARDPRYFTYLENAAVTPEIVLDDGRLGLEAEADGSLALLVIDAFSSDSVPAHLLTLEALSLYLDKVAAGGWAVLHLSNRSLDLPRVVANGAARAGLAARHVVDDSASYVVLARREADLAALGSTARLPAGDPGEAWTDRFSSLLSAIRYRGGALDRE